MEIKEIEFLLKKTEFEHFIGFFQKIKLKDYEYNNIFKTGNEKSGFYLLKIIENYKPNVIDSINILKEIKDPENIINKNIGFIEKENCIITVSEWLNGKQPIENKENLPIFFSKLALLNKNNITNGPYTSMYLDYKYFDNATNLIDYEVNNHIKFIPENIEIKPLLKILENLKNGIICIIHEDMNCGNLFITNNGKYKIIDTEWVVKGINLYQFQHFDYFGFCEKNWYNITENAKDCYKAYFETLGINYKEANEQIRAVELLNTLRENTYIKHSGKEKDKDIENRIKIIMEWKKFI